MINSMLKKRLAALAAALTLLMPATALGATAPDTSVPRLPEAYRGSGYADVVGMPEYGTAVARYCAEPAGEGITVERATEAFKSGVPDGFNLCFLSSDGRETQDSAPVSTGMTIAVRDDKDAPWGSIDVVVMGDVLGNGVASVTQLIRLSKAVQRTDPLTGNYLAAGDWNDNGSIDITDLVYQARLLTTTEDIRVSKNASGVALENRPYSHNQSDFMKAGSNAHLFVNPDGGYTRVHAVLTSSFAEGNPTGEDPFVIVEEYTKDFVPLSSKRLPFALSKFGGAYSGADYNFLIFCQDNPDEDDNVAVLRVVRYDKNWQQVDCADLKGVSVRTTIRFSNIACAEKDGFLYLQVPIEAYIGPDGISHQAAILYALRESDMQYTYKGEWGVSHSFGQGLFVDSDNNLVKVNVGDGYPRALYLAKFTAFDGLGAPRKSKFVDLVDFPGAIGDNDTGCLLGDVAETEQGYVCAYTRRADIKNDPARMYCTYVDKGLQNVKTVQLSSVRAAEPKLVANGTSGGYLLWEEKFLSRCNMWYAEYDASGNVSEPRIVYGVRLSECDPVLVDGKIVWHDIYRGTLQVFYSFDVASHEMSRTFVV